MILDNREMAQLLGLSWKDPFPIIKEESGEYVIIGDQVYKKLVRRVKGEMLSPDEWGTRTSSSEVWYWKPIEGGISEDHQRHKKHQESLKEAAEIFRMLLKV